MTETCAVDPRHDEIVPIAFSHSSEDIDIVQGILREEGIETVRAGHIHGIWVYGRRQVHRLEVLKSQHDGALRLLSDKVRELTDEHPWVDRHGHCGACGYDVSATLHETTVCPECGTDLARQAQRQALACIVSSHDRVTPMIGAIVGIITVVLVLIAIVLFIMRLI